MTPRYADFDLIMSARDMDGNLPPLVITVGGRKVGKTYGATWWLMKQYFEFGTLFIVETRTKTSLGSVAEGMMKVMIKEQYPDWVLKETLDTGEGFSRIFLTRGEEKHHVGYVVPVNTAGNIKGISSMFADAEYLVFDEFIPEFETSYVPREHKKHMSLIVSIKRNQPLRVIMIANTVELDNIYFKEMVARDGVTPLNRVLNDSTNKYRGRGYVVHRYYESKIAEANMTDPLIMAFGGGDAEVLTGENWGGSKSASIMKPTKEWGGFVNICTLVSNGKEYGVRYYSQPGIHYLSNSVDPQSKLKYRITLGGEINVPLLKYEPMFKHLKQCVVRGQFRYETAEHENIGRDLIV